MDVICLLNGDPEDPESRSTGWWQLAAGQHKACFQQQHSSFSGRRVGGVVVQQPDRRRRQRQRVPARRAQARQGIRQGDWATGLLGRGRSAVRVANLRPFPS